MPLCGLIPVLAGAVDEVVGLVDGLDLNSMFGAALGLAEPWQVVSVEFDQDADRLDLGLDFPRGARFGCPEPGCAETEEHSAGIVTSWLLPLDEPNRT